MWECTQRSELVSGSGEGLVLWVHVGSAMSDFCDPVDCSPPVSSVHGVSQQEWMGCHFFLQEFFLTQGLNLHLLHLALADGSFTTDPPGRSSAVWDDLWRVGRKRLNGEGRTFPHRGRREPASSRSCEAESVDSREEGEGKPVSQELAKDFDFIPEEWKVLGGF